MQYTAVIGAMEEEIVGLLKGLQNIEQIEPGTMDFPLYKGLLGGKPVLVARCGIGKVNAALCTQYLIDKFPIQAIINSGVAGAINPDVRIGDLVVSTSALYHDFDAKFFGYPKGAIPRMAISEFSADGNLVKLALQESRAVMGHERVHSGLIVSGDQFVAGSTGKQSIVKDFPEAMCVEMEGAAIAHAAYQNQVPFVILRTMSDQADDTAPEDFDAYLAKVIPELNAVVTKTIAGL